MFEKKLDTDPYLDKLAESDPDTYHELLLEFLKWPETREAITRHEKTPMAILRNIAAEKGAPWDNLLSHPNCPPELITKKLKSGKDAELWSLVQNCSLSEDQVRTLAKSNEGVCRRPDCPPDLLEGFFTICEQQWGEANTRIKQEVEEHNSGSSSDDDLFFGDDNFSDYFEINEDLLLAIASNPNTPQQVFKKMLTMDVNKKWFGDRSLGATLMGNPSVSSEDKAVLSLQGFIESEKDSNQIVSMISHHGLPTSIAFEFPKFPLRFKEALNAVGHPSALLHPDFKVTNQEYSFNEIVDIWVKNETIYRTLWPELTEREDLSLQYWRSSHSGDHFHLWHEGVDFKQDFSEVSEYYNSMGYPSIERPWLETDETLDIEMSHEEFSTRDVEELLDWEVEDDVLLAAIISKNALSQEDESPQYTLTKKGEGFVCKWAESFFEEERMVKVVIYPEKALPYSWKALSIEKKEQIAKIIIQGFKQKVDTKYQFAEHFLTCIALHPHTPDSIKNTLKTIDSNLVREALSVSRGK
jgi:hypothetical protein